MSRTIIALFAAGAVIGVALVTRRVSRKTRAHASEMAAHCKEMMVSMNGCAEVLGEREFGGESGKQQGVGAPATP